jgi:hypothetical protein
MHKLAGYAQGEHRFPYTHVGFDEGTATLARKSISAGGSHHVNATRMVPGFWDIVGDRETPPDALDLLLLLKTLGAAHAPLAQSLVPLVRRTVEACDRLGFYREARLILRISSIAPSSPSARPA